MSIYIIAKINIEDRIEYAKYEEGFAEIFSKYKGRLLSVDEAPEILEGSWSCTRTVLIEFPSRDDAMMWYRSDEYQDLAKHRFSASDADIVLIDALTSF